MNHSVGKSMKTVKSSPVLTMTNPDEYFGKTKIVESFAKKNNIPIINFTIEKSAPIEDILGTIQKQ